MTELRIRWTPLPKLALLSVFLLSHTGCTSSLPPLTETICNLVTSYEQYLESHCQRPTGVELDHMDSRPNVVDSSSVEALALIPQPNRIDNRYSMSVADLTRPSLGSNAPRNDIVDTFGKWHKEISKNFDSIDTGSRIKISISPLGLSLDEWKITIKNLLRYPIKAKVSPDAFEFRYTLPWPRE